jgi:hypothetical protein
MAANQANSNNPQQENNANLGDGFEVARRLQNDKEGRVTIEGSAPWRQGKLEVAGQRFYSPELGDAGEKFPGGGIVHDVRNTAVIKIDVQVLKQNELGLLNATGDQLQANLATALREKQAEDLRKYKLNPEQMVEKSKELGYYGSGAHQAWAEAASARTGGRASPEYMMKLDPLGGTNGNGPNIEKGGIYPHPLSKIGMAHDTDWSLGRYFNAGPLNGLYKNTGKDADLGMYGLQALTPGRSSPIDPQPKAQYAGIGGNDIWKIEYNQQPTKTRRAGVDSDDGTSLASADLSKPNARVSADAETRVASVSPALVPGNDRLNAQFEQALKVTGGDPDAAALAVKTINEAPGYKPDQDISVTQGKNGFIVSQGQGDSALNLQVPAAKPGDFDKVATQMAQPQPTQQIAMQTDQPEQRIKGPTV